MEICRVEGSITSTAKDSKLVGLKLMIVRPLSEKGGQSHSFVATDTVGAGVDEKVLVVRGGAARMTTNTMKAPTDAAIVAIIDPNQGEIGES